MNNNSLNMKSLLHRAHSQGISNGFLPFWAAMLNEVLDPIDFDTKILEFGAQGADFLRLAYLAYPYAKGLGITLDIDRKSSPTEFPTSEFPYLQFLDESAIELKSGEFDLAFSHEVLGLLPDLHEHAAAIERLLSPGGVYYAAFGWHGDNPASSMQAPIRAEKKLPFHPHMLGEVAGAFHSAGFEVSFKRLPLPFFLVYEPEITSRRFGGVPEMISCLQDQKVLFALRKGRVHHD